MTKATSVFDVPLFKLTGKKKPKAKDIGIEIEAEVGPKDMNPVDIFVTIQDKEGKPKYWGIKGDGSLRNGAEYFSNGPIAIGKMDEAMEEFMTYSKGCKFREDSIRTSVHYHVNVSDLTLNQILAVIVGWWFLETPVVNTQGPTRVGNLFCLRVSDAEHLVQDVLRSVEEDTTPLLGHTLGDNVKYAALNINAVSRFGSLEFRFNKGTVDPSEIDKWGRMLYTLVRSFAAMGTPSAVVEFYERAQAVAFATRFLPTWLIKLFTGRWEQGIDSNYSYAYLVAQKVKDLQTGDDDNVRVVSRPMVSLNPDEQEYPYEDTGIYKTEEYSPDEDQLPAVRFLSAYMAPRKKKGFPLGFEPAAINWNPHVIQAAPIPQSIIDQFQDTLNAQPMWTNVTNVPQEDEPWDEPDFIEEDEEFIDDPETGDWVNEEQP